MSRLQGHSRQIFRRHVLGFLSANHGGGAAHGTVAFAVAGEHAFSAATGPSAPRVRAISGKLLRSTWRQNKGSFRMGFHQACGSRLICGATLSIWGLLLLTGCATGKAFEAPDLRGQLEIVRAEVNQLRSDTTHLQSDLKQTTESLQKLAERLHQLDRRFAVTAGQSPQTKGQLPSEAVQELKRAVEVLLEKALETESRLTGVESRLSEARRLEERRRQPSQQRTETSEASQQVRKELKHGMTQEEVRRMLGNPTSTEGTPVLLYWYYSAEKYVYFSTDSGRLRGWRGF